MAKFVTFLAIIMLSSFLSISCQTSSSAGLSANDPVNDPAKTPSKTDEQATAKQPVLVELFTSEGCSSCPPADKALAFLDKQQPVSNAQIIALELHVDYWDTNGWKDPFSSATLTQRQRWYGQKLSVDPVFTPQMVVDGSSQLIGSDLQTANLMIAQLAKDKKANIALSKNGEKLNIKIDPVTITKDATVFLAIAENNLETRIKGGENSGLKLPHTAVVRQLGAVGTLKTNNKGLEAEVGPNFQPDWKKNDLKAVVFIQENESGKILGVAQLSLADGK